MSNNFTYDIHYTFSKSLGLTGGDIGAYYGSDNGQNNIQEFDNPRADRGPNPGDTPHRVVGDFIYEMPQLKGSNPLLRHSVGGWQIAGIVSARTGERLIISQACASTYHCRPDYAGGATVVENWRDAGTSRCIAGARCNLQYSISRRSPWYHRSQSDAIRPAIWATERFADHRILASTSRWPEHSPAGESEPQFRTDMFSALNRVNYSGPTTGFNSATFGQISGAGGMRVMQLNAKLSW
ncbi:MAG: hypothetical protein WKF37_23095 [Bryobacteraceae bacterium]